MLLLDWSGAQKNWGKCSTEVCVLFVYVQRKYPLCLRSHDGGRRVAVRVRRQRALLC